MKAEEIALQVMGVLPDCGLERTRDVIQLSHGGEAGIVIIVTREAIEFRLPTVEWTMGAYGPAASSETWKRVPTANITERRLSSLISGAFAARQKQFRECRYCKQLVPQEHRYNDDICHGCASEHLKVVY